MTIKKTFKKTEGCIKELEKMKKAPKKVVEMTIKDFKKRAPGWVAQEVVNEYNIKKGEIKPVQSKTDKKPAGTIRGEGKTIASARLIYRGRVLTPVHFGMTPKVIKQTYTLKAQFKKGDKITLGRVKKLTKKQRKNIGRNFTRQGTRSSQKSPIMLMNTGNKKVDGIQYIPMQRQSGKRDDIKAIKTLSLPQMVSNPKVEKGIQEQVNENVGKRFNHHLNRYMMK